MSTYDLWMVSSLKVGVELQFPIQTPQTLFVGPWSGHGFVAWQEQNGTRSWLRLGSKGIK